MKNNPFHIQNFGFFVLLAAYPNINKLKCCFIVFLFLTAEFCKAQINATTPDASFGFDPTDTYSAFELPTETDALLLSNGNPVQVAVSNATTPNPEFHYNYNNGQYVGSASILRTDEIQDAVHLYADDVVLITYNGTATGSNLVAFIACRADMGGGVTKICYYPAVWFTGANSFTVLSPIIIDSRTEPTPVDYFDRVSIAYKNAGNHVPSVYPTEVGIAYSKNGGIVIQSRMASGILLDLGSGGSRDNVFYDADDPGGAYSNPDIAVGSTGHFGVSALYRVGNIQKLVVKVTDHEPGTVPADWGSWTAYSINDPGKRIRTPRLDQAWKYDFVLCFNELDQDNARSNIVVVARSYLDDVPDILNDWLSAPYIINSELEAACDGNYNYVYTGFPVVKYYNNSLSEPFGYKFEVVWQQTACTTGSNDFCNINAISKRFSLSFSGSSSVVISPLYSNQFFYLSDDNRAEKNTIFPSLASIRDGCTNFYSFGKMDDATSANGEVAYKQSSCDGASLRPYTSAQQNNNAAPVSADNVKDSKQPGLYVYPNPGRDAFHVSITGFMGNTKAYLYNATGGLISIMNISGKANSTIDIGKLPAGSYLVKVMDEKGTTLHKKIVIAK